MIRTLATLCLAATLTDCASVSPSSDLGKLEARDVAAALAIAQVGKDPVGVACFTAVQSYLATVPALPPAAGVLSEIERLRLLAINYRAGWPREIRIACPGLMLP